MDKSSLKCIRNSEDLISQLPDEILIFILSPLKMKEAIRTSVLSHRWECLWSFTDTLDFDDPDTMQEIDARKKKLKTERKKFVKRVNRILGLHQASTINKFRVCFELGKNSTPHIDSWLDFAISKRVKRLELDFTPLESMRHYYTFSHEQLTRIISKIGVHCINFLTSLTLKYVNVTGELLEHCLSVCPVLEKLHVARSQSLVRLKISGPSLQLKYLHIINCSQIKDVLIGGVYLVRISYLFCPLSNYLSQLQHLMLDICNFNDDNLEFPDLQGLLNLRHLEVRVAACNDGSLLGLIPLIEATRVLHKFSLELSCFAWSKPLKERELRKVMKCPNEHLKVVEIMGFVGRAIDIELTVYLLEIAVNLEKICINPRAPHLVGTPWEAENEGARESAKQLKKHLPLGAELVIL